MSRQDFGNAFKAEVISTGNKLAIGEIERGTGQGAALLNYNYPVGTGANAAAVAGHSQVIEGY